MDSSLNANIERMECVAVVRGYDLKKVVAWSFYDWANSAFSTTVMAGFFPVFFKQYWSAGSDVSITTFKLGMGNSLASLLVAFIAPVLGAIADRGSARKSFLLFFAAMGILMTGLLYGVPRGEWEYAVACYVLAAVGFYGGNIFYDSLLVTVAPGEKVDFVSALGFSLGYLGGGILFALNILMTLFPASFGLADASEGVRLSFLSVALWWGLFSIPIFAFVDEPGSGVSRKTWDAIQGGVRQLRSTLAEAQHLRVVFLFLVGYWFYIDAVDTIILMAVDYGLSIGLTSKSLLGALLLTQFVGFPAAIAFGRIGERLGAKTGILAGIGVYLGVTLWAFTMHSELEFYLLAATVGLVQGGVQSLSRSFYTRLIPRSKAGEFFGLYNMLGKFAAIVGPGLMGTISLLGGNPRYSIFGVTFLFLCGGTILFFVDEKRGSRLAEEMESV
jgi:MFS transporter, UMF1 family